MVSSIIMESTINLIRKMLTDALRAMINNPLKEIFSEKRKEKVINILTTFLFPIKIVIKLS